MNYYINITLEDNFNLKEKQKKCVFKTFIYLDDETRPL